MNNLQSTLFHNYEEKKQFSIRLEKNIPVSAGLGGGSSDAAALLKGLNQICGFPLKEDILLQIGRDLGSDVPFFLYEANFAYGRDASNR